MTENPSLTNRVLKGGHNLTPAENTRINEIVEAMKKGCDKKALLISFRQDEIDFADLRLSTERKNKAIAEAFNSGHIQSMFFDY